MKMYNVKFSNGKIMSFSSKNNLLQYISKNWSVQAYQIVIKDKQISITNKLGRVFAVIGIVEQKFKN